MSRYIKFIIFLILGIFYTSASDKAIEETGVSSTPATTSEGKLVERSTERDLYKKREWSWQVLSKSPYFAMLCPVLREGGSGPCGTIQVNAHVKSTKLFESLRDFQTANDKQFIFDPKDREFFTYTKQDGHPALNFRAQIPDLRCLGGEFKWEEDVLRTNEMSGHYGRVETAEGDISKWTDDDRYALVNLMSSKGYKILHEPYTKDGIFSTLSNQDLQVYQMNFLRRYNHPSNVQSFSSIFLSDTVDVEEKAEKYLKTGRYIREEERVLKLKPQYEGKGELDLFFDCVDSLEVERILLEKFRKDRNR